VSKKNIASLTKPSGCCVYLFYLQNDFLFVEWDVKPYLLTVYLYLFLDSGWMKSGDASGKTYKGTIEIPNLSEEHEPQDVDITVTTSDSASFAETLKEFIRTKGVDKIREKLGQYSSGLRKGKMCEF